MREDLIERLREFVVERGKLACGSDIVSACNNSALSLADLRALLDALEAAREDSESLRRLISSIPRTTVSTQREGSDPMREDWDAFDEVPAYITFDADVVAAIDQARGKGVADEA